LEKERRRLEMGSDYETSGDEEDINDEDYYSDHVSYEQKSIKGNRMLIIMGCRKNA
jgi:hypothetical protein